MQVAQTILKQLGGNKFIAMTGAKNIGGTENSLSFKIGSNAKRVTHVKITLTDDDLYDVEYYNIRGTNFKTVAKSEGIYSDMLRKDFEQNTGLYTSL